MYLFMKVTTEVDNAGDSCRRF